MSRLRLKARFAMLVLACLPALALARSQPDFPPPPDASVKWVGKDMSMNGLPMQMRQFVTRKTPDKVARFYRKKWKHGENGQQGYVETSAMAPWRLITRVEDGYLLTVQFQKTDFGGTWGYLAMSPLPDPKAGKPVLGKGIPKIPGSQVMSDIGSRDVGQSGHTVMLINKHSLASNVSFYRHYYGHAGWHSEDDRVVAAGHTHLLSFKKWRKSVKIIVTGAKEGSRVVVNTVTHDLL